MTPSVEKKQLRIGFQKPLDQSPLETPDGWCDGSVQESEHVYRRVWRTWTQDTKKDEIEYEVRYDLENYPQNNCTVYLNEYHYNERLEGYRRVDTQKEREADVHSDYAMTEVAVDLMEEVNEEFRSNATDPTPEEPDSTRPELTDREETLLKDGYQRPIGESLFKTPPEWQGGGIEAVGGGTVSRAWWRWNEKRDCNEEYRVVYDLADKKVTLLKREYEEDSNRPTGQTTLKTVEADWKSDYSMAEAALELMKHANENILSNTEAYYYESRTVSEETANGAWTSTISGTPPKDREGVEIQNVQELVAAKSILNEAVHLDAPTVAFKYKVGSGEDETTHFGSKSVINNRTDAVHSTTELILKPEPRREDSEFVIYFKHKNRKAVYYRVHKMKNTAEVHEMNGGIMDISMWSVWELDRDRNLEEVDYEDTPFSDPQSKPLL